MKKFKSIILSLLAALTLTVTMVVPVTSTFAADPYAACSGSDNLVCKNKDNTIAPVFKNVVNILLFIVGAVAVVVIIIAGIRYVTSAGNATAVSAAKNTLMYAIIGLIVAFLAYAIVNWVYTQFA